MKSKKNKGIIISGGSMNAHNIAVGDKNIINSVNNTTAENIDFESLTQELAKLRMKLVETAGNDPVNFQAIGAVANAELASKEKDENKVIQYLKDAGLWVFETAKSIGVEVVTELIKKQI